MDSDYDLPRPPLVTTAFEKMLIVPSISEVSVFNYQNTSKEKTECFRQNENQAMKKQVRFKSPIQKSLRTRRTESQRDAVVNKDPDSINRKAVIYQHTDFEYESCPKSKLTNFQQIYLANIPDRTLDLSIIDLPKNETITKEPVTIRQNLSDLTNCINPKVEHQDEENILEKYPISYRQFMQTWMKEVGKKETAAGDSVTDMSNYVKEKSAKPLLYIHNETKVNNDFPDVTSKVNICIEKNNFKNVQHQVNESQTQTSFSSSMNEEYAIKDKQDPTMRDLVKIIAQQNEQIINLQKQVAKLLSGQQYPELVCVKHDKGGYQSSLECKTECHKQVENSKPPTVSKLSVGLMTSFEVEFSPQYNNQTARNVTISSSKEKNMGQHFTNKEPLRESLRSPDPSMNIKMQDYEISNMEETVTELTMYKNLLQQVNQILEKANFRTNKISRARNPPEIPTAYRSVDRTIINVKGANGKHLQKFGMTTDYSDQFNSTNKDKKNYNCTEISCAVNQLLMKYLPNDQLVIAARKLSPEILNTVKLSFASIQHMKKYDLLPQVALKANSELSRSTVTQNYHQNIIDMEALKMQPKLI